jgi:hypothetical protein
MQSCWLSGGETAVHKRKEKTKIKNNKNNKNQNIKPN